MSAADPSTNPVTFLDRVDPRARLLVGVAIAIAAVLTPDPIFKAAIFVLLLIAWALSGIPLRLFLASLSTLVIFFVGTLFLDVVLMPPSGGSLVHLGLWTISISGVSYGAGICLQVADVVVALTLVLRSMSPVIFAEAGERLLSPLKRWHFPIHEGALMMSISLRFLPILGQEFHRLQLAQISRGGAHRRGVLARARALPSIVIPLLIVTIVRAKSIAEAMESRGYRGDVGRSEIRVYRYQVVDVVVLAASTAVLVAAVIGRVGR